MQKVIDALERKHNGRKVISHTIPDNLSEEDQDKLADAIEEAVETTWEDLMG